MKRDEREFTWMHHRIIAIDDMMRPTHPGRMRTTITLTPQAEARIRALMRERGIGFKEAVNAAILSSTSSEPVPFVQETADLGASRADLTKALQLAGELEDEELVHRYELHDDARRRERAPLCR